MSWLLNWLFLLFFFHFLHLFGSCITFNFVFRPITNLTFPWTVPNWFALGTSFESLFSTLSAFESLQKSLNTVIWVKFCKVLHVLFFSLIHWLLESFLLFLCKLFPIDPSTYTTQYNRNLLDHERIDSQMCGDIHQRQLFEWSQHGR